MTPAELDVQLRTLSEHEKAYQRGEKPAATDRPVVMIDGVPIMKSTFFTEVPSAGKRVATPLAESNYSANSLVRIKQHSRFREYPLHMHDFVELAYMYSGCCVETLNGRIQGIREHQVLLVDSDTIHTIAPLREEDILVNIQIEKSFFTANFFNRLDTGSLVTSFFINAISRGVAHNNYILFKSEKSRRLPIFMNELMCECYEPSPRSSNMLEGLLSVVVAELVNVYEHGIEEGTMSQQTTAVQVLQYIEDNYRTCTLEKTAEEFCVSTSYLTKMLKRECGMTYKELVQQQRIAVAKRLLADESLSVTDVARNVGYSNMSFFYKVFRRECGMQPGDYRAYMHEHR